MLKLLSFLVIIFTFGVGQMWGATYVKVTSASDLVAGQVYVIAEISASTKYLVTGYGTKLANTTTGFTVSNNTITTSTATPLEFTLGTVTSGNNTYYTLQYVNNGTKYLGYSGSSTNFEEGTGTTNDKERWSITSTNNFDIRNVSTLSASTIRRIGRNSANIGPYATSYTACYLFKKQASCTNSVIIAKGTESNASLSFSSTSVQTCSGTATDRQVTVSVSPASCYAAPVAASVTASGTTATPVSGPTWNNTTSKYDYVYQFAQNAKGTTTFNVSLSTKTTYTVNYNKGNAAGATGDASSDTKTCGDALTLPSSALFTRTGYTQQGWSTAQAGTTKTYNLGGSYTTDAATTLYPYWQANSYSVTWMVNNAAYTTGGGSTSVNHGSHITTVSSAPNPLPCGDKFVGWTTDAEYVHNSSPLYTTASQFPNATTNQIFYAVFADYDE